MTVTISYYRYCLSSDGTNWSNYLTTMIVIVASACSCSCSKKRSLEWYLWLPDGAMAEHFHRMYDVCSGSPGCSGCPIGHRHEWIQDCHFSTLNYYRDFAAVTATANYEEDYFIVDLDCWSRLRISIYLFEGMCSSVARKVACSDIIAIAAWSDCCYFFVVGVILFHLLWVYCYGLVTITEMTAVAM